MNANAKLKGQTALVTGASSGIGEGVAIALANDGANVIVNCSSHPQRGQEVVDKIKANGGNALVYQADVSNEEQVQAMFAAAIEAFGTIDILVNNSGIQKDLAFADMSLADWQKVIDVNLTGQFLCAREAVKGISAPGYRSRKKCCGRKDHLHEQCARSDTLGGSC